MPLSNYIDAANATTNSKAYNSATSVEARALETTKAILDIIRVNSEIGETEILYYIAKDEVEIVQDSLIKRGFSIKSNVFNSTGYYENIIDWSPVPVLTEFERLAISVGDTFTFVDTDPNVTGTWQVTRSDDEIIHFDQLIKRTDLRLKICVDNSKSGLFYKDGQEYISYKTLDWGANTDDLLYIHVEGSNGFLAEFVQ